MSSISDTVQLAGLAIDLVQEVFQVDRKVAEIWVQGFVPFELPLTEIQVLEGGAKRQKNKSLPALVTALAALVVAGSSSPVTRFTQQVDQATFAAINANATALFGPPSAGLNEQGLYGFT